jgi:hypothetical protein
LGENLYTIKVGLEVNIKITNRSFEDVVQFKYFGMAVTKISCRRKVRGD